MSALNGQNAQPPVISIATPINPSTGARVPEALLEERGGVQPPQEIVRVSPIVIGVSPPASANPSSQYYSTLNDFTYVAP
jgi:hypothetical protein